MPDLDQLLRPDISLAATQAAQPFDFTRIERRGTQRRRHRTLLGVAAALVGVGVALAGSLQIASSNRAAPTTVLQQPSPKAMPPAGEGDLEGTYLSPADASSAFAYTITFPVGWRVQGGNEYLFREDQPGAMSILPFQVRAIYTDACRGDQGTVTTVGPRPRDLITALQAQQSTVTSTPVETTIGGYPATRIDVRMKPGIRIESCSLKPGSWLQLWVDPPGRYEVLHGNNTVSVYVVDVAGERQVFAAHYSPSSPAKDLAELQQILDSIRFQRP